MIGKRLANRIYLAGHPLSIYPLSLVPARPYSFLSGFAENGRYSKDVFRMQPKIMPSIQKSDYVAFPEGIPICESSFLAFSFDFV
jgi:hypothetical protein